ncbi:MAG: GNAT family N-acetyltransferase [Flammeovirgaceae bacterium]|nr:GNAT family N-acetyltransferase [Flammeovirgaceae bacterium]
MNTNDIIIRVATPDDKHYAEAITTEMAESAKARGTGIAQRTPEYVQKKMEEGKAVIATTSNGTWVGFCYIEAWEHEKYVANSGLIVSPAFRKEGVATGIKKKTFELSRKKYPEAKIFGLTTGLAVMKINSELGYEPVTYSELTTDEEFWKGCRSCVNFEILMSKNRSNCLCTAMMYKDPAKELPKLEKVVAMRTPIRKRKKRKFANNFRLFERWIRFKRHVLLNERKKKSGQDSPEKKSILSFLYFW